MHNIEHRWLELRHLDELAAQQTAIHELHPTIKLLTTLIFIITVASFSKYEIASLLPMFFYPIALMSVGNIPVRLLANRVMIMMPFILFIGILNPFFDQATMLTLGSIPISGGVVSFISILLRFILSVLAALILIATTGMDSICMALSSLGVPRILVTEISFVYRYVHVLIEEVTKTVRSYSLRSPYSKGIEFQTWGSLIGLLLLRAIDRAQRIYQAMVCRGFDGEVRLIKSRQLRKKEIVFLLAWSSFFAAARTVNIPHLLGSVLLGGYK